MSFVDKLKGKNVIVILFLLFLIGLFAYLFAKSVSGFSELNPYQNNQYNQNNKNNKNNKNTCDSYGTGRYQSPSGHLTGSSMFKVPDQNEMDRLLEGFKQDHPNDPIL